jgi:acetyl esterase/lipase
MVIEKGSILCRSNLIALMKHYLWIFAISALSACQKQDNPAGDNNTPQILLNVAYGNDPEEIMDIYLPAGRNINATKVIVLIHGGGWTEGDKSDFTSFVSTIQNLLTGYAIFNINYKLASTGINLFPSQENDIKAAIDFIYSKKDTYHISDKFVYLGASAGGHLALLQAYKYDTPVKAKAVVSFFGPTDLTALYNTNVFAALILAQVIGNIPTGDPVLYQQSSPVTFVTTSSPPTLLLHGGLDPLVPPAQAELLKASLSNSGVPNQYVFYPNEAHGWTGSNLDDSFNKIAAFLNDHVN